MTSREVWSADFGAMEIEACIERWPMKRPFHINGHVFNDVEVLHVQLRCDGLVGEGEGAGVFYRGDMPQSMLGQLDAVRAAFELRASRAALHALLPRGGARNALDCALWDLQAKVVGQSVSAIIGKPDPQPLRTTFTCGADTPEKMAAAALAYEGAAAIKLKLLGDALDSDRIAAVRSVLPDVWLGADANQAFSPDTLAALLPVLEHCGVSLLEQPLPAGDDYLLAGWDSPVQLAADESVQGVDDLARLVGCYDVINIKLDKCGGLTEALAMSQAAHALGFKTMVGNMMGTSLSMEPAMIVGQSCDIVDLDGPIFLASDRHRKVSYESGEISTAPAGWGCP